MNENSLPVHLSSAILVDMASANSSIIFVFGRNRNDRLGIVRVVKGLVEMTAFDLGLFHIWVLDDMYELVFSEIQNTLNHTPRSLAFRRNL